MSRTRRPTSRPALLAGDPRGGSGGLPSLVRVTGPRYDTILGNRRVALFGNMGPDKRSEGVISPSSLNPGGPPSGFHASGASTPRREVFALRKLPGTGAAPIGRREAVIAGKGSSELKFFVTSKPLPVRRRPTDLLSVGILTRATVVTRWVGQAATQERS